MFALAVRSPPALTLALPLAEVIAIEFTMPLWIAILAAAFLGERLYGWKIAALIVGFGGVLMIVKPGLTLNVGHLVALSAALLFAVSVTLTKYITRRDTALTVIFFMFTMQTVIGAAHFLAGGMGSVAVAGGMENMSAAPYLLPKAREGFRLGGKCDLADRSDLVVRFFGRELAHQDRVRRRLRSATQQQHQQ